MADFDNTPALPAGNTRPVYVPPPAPRRVSTRLIAVRLLLALCGVRLTDEKLQSGQVAQIEASRGRLRLSAQVGPKVPSRRSLGEGR